MSAMISISGLHKSYKNKQVLNDVNLTLSAGQILGLVGPNGAGKTTCLQALLGLTTYDGDIDVLGYNPSKSREKMLVDVAYIADVAVLPKWIQVDQALTYMQGVHPNFDRQKAAAFLAKTNIPATAKVKTLSKGMVTQLHLALILAVDAKILILDEPTLGLDILTRRQFYAHLLEDFYDADKCIIVTTHQIEEIEHILTDAAFIRDGRIVLDQSVDDIRIRFKLVAVDNAHLEQAKTHNPLYTNSMMGITSMLFDNVDPAILATLGKVSAPTLADIFVGMMTKETIL
ncbi:ABC transporter ATP-binding protein [Paraglaciecola sp. MB-3u-78]|uniref:ABC transporter ATP-binding protein n=1 Tax=Paraglaciecola sp. MB-3u-78 TaxID=2058332 RepID=UPI000C32D70F|nr:ABC transporter ATP-binding protein [Paraglaciecola sp. MB-3u-78]PKG98349.1 multidrug ABC transporter ATP-binding protein [Paraglaciecola sp. MB-3u-78]